MLDKQLSEAEIENISFIDYFEYKPKFFKNCF